MIPMAHVPAAYLRQAALTPAIRAIKQRAYALLGLLPGAAVLDIGCGPGISTPDLARIVGPLGLVRGIDHDAAMIAEADEAASLAGVAAWTAHRQADAAHLPFATGAFDACFSDRVLQHLPADKAAACLAEAARVTRQGGAVVFVDTDWGSFSVDFMPTPVERRLQALHAARFRNPYAGRALGRLMAQAGLEFVGTEPVAVPLAPAQVINLLAGTVDAARSDGMLDDDTLAAWQRARAGAAGHVIIVIAAGVVAGRVG